MNHRFRLTSRQLIRLDDLVMLVLALLSVFLLVLEVTEALSPERVLIADRVDLYIALIFLGEFLLRLTFSHHKTLFLKRHWWDLLAAIPVTIPITQILRLLRVVRVFLHLRVAREDERRLTRA